MAVSVGVGMITEYDCWYEYDYSKLKCSFCKISILWIRKQRLHI